ncbi:MAG TPA: hypothetical protein VN826_10110, partial [Candidatus Eisenbacteria bacterium]|nr:hypothetical protein [Candidatus Eisenbacteria bacterium]
RLGFEIVENTREKLRLVWHGARFPAFLCLGIAVLLLFVSVPIIEALRVRGFAGPAGALWYFPVMNFILFAIALFLVTQRRVIELDSRARQVILRRHSLYRSIVLSASYDEIDKFKLGFDQVYSGFALGGSTAAQKFSVPALRMVLRDGAAVLLDRGSVRKLRELGKLASELLSRPLEIELAGPS